LVAKLPILRRRKDKMRSILKLKVMATPVLVCVLSQFVAAQDPGRVKPGLNSGVVTLDPEAKMLDSPISGEPPPCCPFSCPECQDVIKKRACADLRYLGIFVRSEKGESFVIDEAALHFSDKTGKWLWSVTGDGIGCGDNTKAKTRSTGCLLTLNESAAAKAAAKKYFADGNHIKVNLTGMNMPNVIYFVDVRSAKPVK
jgi:hypothetical protein